MKALTFFLIFFIAISHSAVIKIEIEKHGFLLNWITVSSSILVSKNHEYTPISKYSRHFYIFADYFGKLLKEKTPASDSHKARNELKVNLSLFCRRSYVIESVLQIDTVDNGIVSFKPMSFSVFCSDKNDFLITDFVSTIDELTGMLDVNAKIECTQSSPEEITLQLLAENANNNLSKKVGIEDFKNLVNLGFENAEKVKTKIVL